MTGRLASHFYVPAHMTRTSRGNVKPCCDRPADEHPAFVDKVPVRIRLVRQVRGLRGTVYPKGSVVGATRDAYGGMVEVRPSRWGTNVLGQFAQLDKGEYRYDAPMPGYLIVVDGTNTLIPASYAKEV